MPHIHAMVPRLQRFLAAQDANLAHARVTAYEPITGGLSRVMARFALERDGLTESLVLRTDPVAGTAIIDSDRAAEWDLLQHVHLAGEVAIPRPRWFDATGEFLGSPGIVMEAVEGASLVTIARSRSATGQVALAVTLADLAAAVTRVPVASLPDRFTRPCSWTTYIDEQIAQWATLERANLGSDPFMRYVGAWLDANRPPPAPLCLVHGDFQISNVIVDSYDAFTLVDWELGHVGDPREDIGWFRLVGALTPPDLIGLDEAGFCARYRERTGLSADVINPTTLLYFTLLASLKVFAGLQSQAAALSRGDGGSTAIAYCTLVQSSIHRVWIGAIADFMSARGAQ
jgi:aminoglycoside phosphotransferase (APT) family kinase protein